MPSDIVWVAVAGGIATVAGMLGAAFVAAKIQGRTLKMQLDFNQEQLAQQLEHQRREARITRLVGVRQGYLVPLRKAVATWMIEAEGVIAAIARIQIAARDKDSNPSHYASEFQNWKKRMDASEQAGRDLEERILCFPGMMYCLSPRLQLVNQGGRQQRGAVFRALTVSNDNDLLVKIDILDS